jgi:uncharacterized protein (TIGR02145 family)
MVYICTDNLKTKIMKKQLKTKHSKLKTMKKLATACLIAAGTITMNAQNVGINSTGVPPHPSAGLDINFTDRGLLIPRMTTAQRNAIASPTLSLLIFNTDNNCFQTYNSIAGVWENLYCFTSCTSTPSAPTANNATGISTTSFVANWGSVAGATGYYLDVATNAGFTSFVPGYNNQNVGNVTNINVTGLTCGATYYYRIRAYNACGTSANSTTITVTTNACIPTTPACGTQVWMAANLNVGTQIPASTTQGLGDKWCYNDNAANCTTYGGLYQWTTVVQISNTFLSTLYGTQPWMTCDPCGSSGRQGICPAGYHVPTDLEWSRYEYCIENNIAPTGSTPLSTFQTTTGWRGSTTAGVGPGDKMKVTSSNTPSWDGTNTSGFSALPAGSAFSGSFGHLGAGAYFWSATENSSTLAWGRILYTGNAPSGRVNYVKTNGFSVRCLKN